MKLSFQGEIDAREDSFRSTAEAGQLLLDDQAGYSDDVREKLMTLANEKTALLNLYEERRILYEQCMDLQLFYRDTEQADTWMAKQEVSGGCGLYTSMRFLLKPFKSISSERLNRKRQIKL